MKLNRKQSQYFAEVFNNAGAVFLAGMIVPVITRVNEKIDVRIFLLGIAYSVLCWWIGYKLLEEENG